MIDPREIRSGNWVLKITGRDINAQSFFEYKAIGFDEHYYTFAKACFPIKITPAILQNSGFKQVSGDWYINWQAKGKDDELPFLSYHQADGCWYLKQVKLWSQPVYVHQLQNLFYALTDEELDIQLGRFENLAMMGPMDFFVKPVDKNYRVRELL
jgi:hypothetical protein